MKNPIATQFAPKVHTALNTKVVPSSKRDAFSNPLSRPAAYMDAINAAPVSPGARYLAGMIALKLEYIARVMRDCDLSFIEAVVSADSDKRMPESDVQLLLDECGEVGILERGRIAGKKAALPRIPDWVRPC